VWLLLVTHFESNTDWCNSLFAPPFSGFGNLTSLNQALLYGNRFTGSLPESIGQLTALTQVWCLLHCLSSNNAQSLVSFTNTVKLFLTDSSKLMRISYLEVSRTQLLCGLIWNLLTWVTISWLGHYLMASVHGQTCSVSVFTVTHSLERSLTRYVLCGKPGDLHMLHSDLLDLMTYVMLQVGAWSNLVFFNVYNNSFTGNIPDAVRVLWSTLWLIATLYSDCSFRDPCNATGFAMDIGHHCLLQNKPVQWDYSKCSARLGKHWVRFAQLQHGIVFVWSHPGRALLQYNRSAEFYSNDFVGSMPFCGSSLSFPQGDKNLLTADCEEVTCDCCTECYWCCFTFLYYIII